MKELQFFVCKYVQICCTVCKLRECDLGDAARVSCHVVVTQLSRLMTMLLRCSAAARVSVKWKLLPMLTSCCVSRVCVSAAQ